MQRQYWASIFYDGSANFTKTAQKYEERGLAGLEVPQVYGAPFVPLAAAAAASGTYPACHWHRHWSRPQPI